MRVSLVEALFVVASIQGVILLTVLWKHSAQKMANALFGLMITLCLYDQAIVTLSVSGQIVNYPALVRSGFPAGVALATCLYLYVQTVLGRYSTKTISRLHMIPTVLAFIWYVFFTFVIDHSIVSGWGSGSVEEILRLVTVTAVFGFYLVLCVRQLVQFQEKLKGYYSSLREFHLKWLSYLVFLFFLLWVSLFIYTINQHNMTGGILAVFLTGIVLGIGFYGLKHSRLFSEKQLVLNSASQGEVPKQQSASVNPPRGALLSEREMGVAKQRLEKALTQDKIFLKEGLKLIDLAEALGLKLHQTSELINRGFGVPFYDLINHCRVKEAKERLLDPAYKHMNILGIALDCGFTSKSVFNEAFKRYVGVTPSEYRSGKDSPARS